MSDKKIKEKHSVIRQFETVKWINSRHGKTALDKYKNTDEQLRKLEELKRVFTEYDKDKDQNMQVSEICTMLKEAGIHIKYVELLKIFDAVKPKVHGQLDFSEFVKLVQMPEVQKKFAQLIKDVRKRKTEYIPNQFQSLIDFICIDTQNVEFRKQISNGQDIKNDMKIFHQILEPKQDEIYKNVDLEKIKHS